MIANLAVAARLYRMARSCDWPCGQSVHWAFALAFSRKVAS